MQQQGAGRGGQGGHDYAQQNAPGYPSGSSYSGGSYGYVHQRGHGMHPGGEQQQTIGIGAPMHGGPTMGGNRAPQQHPAGTQQLTQQPQTSNANPTVLWEDTKKWVDQIRKASRSQAEFLGILQIDQETLQQWYANPPGRHGPPGTTTKLRQQIKLHLERQRVARNPDRVDPNPQNPNPQNPQQLLMQPTHPGNQPSAGYDRPNMQRQHPVQQHGSGHQGPHLAAGLEGQQAQAPQMAQMSVQSSHQAQQQQLSASQYARVGMGTGSGPSTELNMSAGNHGSMPSGGPAYPHGGGPQRAQQTAQQGARPQQLQPHMQPMHAQPKPNIPSNTGHLQPHAHQGAPSASGGGALPGGYPNQSLNSAGQMPAPAASTTVPAAHAQGAAAGKPPDAATAKSLATAVPGPEELKPLPASALQVKVVQASMPPSLKAFVEQRSDKKDKDAEQLIPIRLNVTAEGQTLRDTFVWKHDPSCASKMTPEQFAKQLCDETDLPHTMQPLILKEINDQINEYLELQKLGNVLNRIDDTSYGCKGELLIKIKIQVRINDLYLQDAFIWDLKQTRNSPEAFARVYVDDMQLPAELVGVIAHSIREQVKDATLKISRAEDAGILKSIRSRWRESDKATWSPAVSWLQQGEREQYERNLKKHKAYHTKAHGGIRANLPMMQAPTASVGRGVAAASK